MSKHTSGPCQAITETGGVTYIKQGKRYLATVAVDPSCCPECKGYARLIAAAPEMVEFIEKIAARQSEPNPNQYVIDTINARALLARIEGEK